MLVDEELYPDEEGLDDEGGLDNEGGLDDESCLGKKKFILIGALALLLIGGGGAGVYFSGILNKPEDVANSEEPAPPRVKMIIYALPEILTNLNGSGRNSSVLNPHCPDGRVIWRHHIRNQP